MASKKTTIMVLKVDLQCSTCYKKVKKLLCKYPQITDQLFDEKTNTVTITVVCCSPEKIRDKLCCKAGKAIKSIDIKDPAPPKPKEPEKPKPKEPEKPKAPEKPKEVEKPKVVTFAEPEKPKAKPTEKPTPKTDPPPKQPQPQPASAPKPATQAPEPGMIKMPDPVHGYPPPVYPAMYPVTATCCGQCYQGYGGGPCQQLGFGRPVPPPPGPSYDGYGYGGNRVCYVTRCDYFSEENPSGCSIM